MNHNVYLSGNSLKVKTNNRRHPNWLGVATKTK